MISSVIALLLVFLTFSGIHIVQPGEIGVIFVSGRLRSTKRPGIYWMPPFIFMMKKVNMRLILLNLSPQKVILRNMATVSVTARLSFHVVDPTVTVMSVTDFVETTKQVSLTSLHTILGQLELAELLGHHEQLNKRLETTINERIKSWGVEIKAMNIQNITHPVDW
jgi:regulator of protease activity HflC (stomatin/prohibitin superfamily)